MRRPARERGAVLVLVLVLALLLTSSIATFLRRAAVDATIARNRDAAARAEALARGGVRLAEALLLEDLLREVQAEFNAETRHDVWARMPEALPAGDDAVLRLRIEDGGARLNLNALFAKGKPIDSSVELLLGEILDKVIAEMPGRPEEKIYDADELARNLIDWIDEDTERVRGGFEDDYYQSQQPRYRAANRSLLSLDELRLVQGFDGKLVDALRPYLTVFPYVKGGGINPNTAPTWVLALLYRGTTGDYRLADEDVVRAVLRVRKAGGVLCDEKQTHPACTPIGQAIEDTVYPPLAYRSDVFFVTSEAEVEGMRRTVEAVLDRSQPTQPKLVYWRVR